MAGFFAPAFCRYLGTVQGLVFGGLTYCLFMASLIYMITPIVLLCSAIIGFGASVLWTSQGMMIAQCTNDSNKATYFAIFWGIFNLCVIPGCLVSHFLLGKKKAGGVDGGSASGHDISNHTAHDDGIKMVIGWNDPNSYLFVFLLFSGLVGIVVVSLLKLTPPDAANGSKPEMETRPVPVQIRATIGLMLKPRMVAILPLFFFTGVQMTMWSSWFTRQMYADVVGLVMIGFGLSEFVGCFSIGPIGDKYGRTVLLSMGTSFWVVGAWLTWSGNTKVVAFCKDVPCDGGGYGCPCEAADYTFFFVASVLYGLGDCCFQTAAGAIAAQDFVVAGKTSDAFALLKTFQSLGGVIGFGISPLLAIHGGKTSSPEQLRLEILMTAASGVAALAGFVLYSGTKIPRHVKTNDAAQPVGKMYSQAVTAGGMLYCAGAVGLRPHESIGDLAGSGRDVGEQTKIACENMVAVLRAGGCEPQDVVKTTVFMANIEDFGAMNKVYKTYFGRKDKDGDPLQVSRRRDSHSAAPPSAFRRCFNRDGERAPSK